MRDPIANFVFAGTSSESTPMRLTMASCTTINFHTGKPRGTLNNRLARSILPMPVIDIGPQFNNLRLGNFFPIVPRNSYDRPAMTANPPWYGTLRFRPTEADWLLLWP
ncbi:hypothetical protein MJO29_011670 [Puccinia striiformis f. sp. tritici]|nr:hypothetical protein MJO29_011670 [Puccinia striiformis f. sp. tritici]